MNKQFEYIKVKSERYMPLEVMNAYGEEGWRICHVEEYDNNCMYVMCREVDNFNPQEHD